VFEELTALWYYVHLFGADNHKEANHMETYLEKAREVLGYIGKSPTAFHVTGNLSEKLSEDGFTGLNEADEWKLEYGKKYYVTRNGSSLVAFKIPEAGFKGFRIMASHSDSPCLKLKELPEIRRDGYTRFNVEKYGGLVFSSWFDRPLSVAGRLFVRGRGGRIEERLVDMGRDMLIIPSQAPHLNKDVNSGYKVNVQKDMLPVFSDEEDGKGILRSFAAQEGIEESDILGSDLYVYVRSGSSIWGGSEQFISSPRLDDQECVWCSLEGFLGAAESTDVQVLSVFDNEEVGSGTKQGALSTFLADVLSRINLSLGRSAEQFYTALAGSFMISADNAHALHPACADRYDPVVHPMMNRGVVLKFSARQSYSTDGRSAAVIRRLCENNDIPLQVFVNHSDNPGGSTLGNLANTHVSIDTADIGLAQLSMHSAYETAGVMDIYSLMKLAKAFYSDSILL
jgi:aspartyl aminopeptidase